MRCQIFVFSTTLVALRGFYTKRTGEVLWHPLREKESPSNHALGGIGTGGEGRKKFEQVQQAIPPIDSEGLTQRQRQSQFADQGHKAGPGRFPKGALNELLQPPPSPPLQDAALHAQSLPERP